MPEPPHILVVEDELHIAHGLVFNLEEEGYRVTHVETGEAALEKAKEEAFALVVLDLMLPGIDGMEVCRRLREDLPRLPILMLTARAQEKDRIAGLTQGADDYLTKPFSLEEFLLRIKGMLRRFSWYRPEPCAETLYCFGDNCVDLEERKATTASGEVFLTELEAKALRYFFEREDATLTRQELLQQVWEVSPDTETRTLDNFIVRLRRYFEKNPAKPKHFLTVRGKGYRFKKEE